MPQLCICSYLWHQSICMCHHPAGTKFHTHGEAVSPDLHVGKHGPEVLSELLKIIQWVGTKVLSHVCTGAKHRDRFAYQFEQVCLWDAVE